ncbi:hypothetical protein ACQJBY_049954 [Aegilops geniculata]
MAQSLAPTLSPLPPAPPLASTASPASPLISALPLHLRSPPSNASLLACILLSLTPASPFHTRRLSLSSLSPLSLVRVSYISQELDLLVTGKCSAGSWICWLQVSGVYRDGFGKRREQE